MGLLESSNQTTLRQFKPDSEWMAELGAFLDGLVESRVNHVQFWLNCNLARFEGGHAAIEDLRRRFDNMVIELRTNVQFCGAQCESCNLLCIRSRLHEGKHNCNTNHECVHNCEFCEDEPGPCRTRYDSYLYLFALLRNAQRRACWEAHVRGSGVHIMNATFLPPCSCVVTAHLCGKPCKLSDRRGCLEGCTKVGGDDRFLNWRLLTYS
jgi:hypothetical protein